MRSLRCSGSGEDGNAIFRTGVEPSMNRLQGESKNRIANFEDSETHNWAMFAVTAHLYTRVDPMTKPTLLSVRGGWSERHHRGT